MKKIFLLLSIFAIALTSCEGDQGPIGPEGPQGPQGPAGEGGGDSEEVATPLMFEVTQDLTLNEESGLRVSELIYFSDNGITPLSTDVVLAYRLERTTDEGDEVWSQLPQNFFLDEGTIQYIFNFSVNGSEDNNSVEFLIDANYDISDLDAFYHENQEFRIVLVPASMAQELDSNLSLENLMLKLDLDDKDIQVMQ